MISQMSNNDDDERIFIKYSVFAKLSPNPNLTNFTSTLKCTDIMRIVKHDYWASTCFKLRDTCGYYLLELH